MGRRSVRVGTLPKYDETIEFLALKAPRFSNGSIDEYDGWLPIPERFSIAENYSESMLFLHRLFIVLYKRKVKTVTIDFDKCILFDLDASICMDLILDGFIRYFKRCTSRGHNIRIKEIIPKNYKDEVKKVLFSIGAFRTFGITKYRLPDILPFDLRIGDSLHANSSGLKEVHETEIVDYVLDCLKKSNRILTSDAEANLSKVVGEVIANAEEHSDFRFRYAIGYFQTRENSEEQLGVFNLVIFNFGQTIYESFSRTDCENVDVVKQMKDLSADYTKKGWFKNAEFEEQSLWTLYAIQEGVTSKKNWKRGNGSIRFIDSFFSLKGNNERDGKSKLTLISGNTRILFDGTYPLVPKPKGKMQKIYKMMTFNTLGDISEKPDDKFITFAKESFPGTMISAKIYINKHSIEVI
jgi:hypothetical protein